MQNLTKKGSTFAINALPFVERRTILMITEQNRKDILELYCQGFSIAEICKEYSGLPETEIYNICLEEDESWDRI